jgi:lipopolysaccharide/colanic/teichoic acid biosynthesis glycosyltransferase
LSRQKYLRKMFNHLKKGRFDLSIKEVIQSVIPLDDIRSTKIITFLLKRTFDIFLSGLILSIVAIPMIFVMILIKICLLYTSDAADEEL